MCGIIGIYHKNKDVAGEIYDGLIQVQHRGQDAAGICTWNKEKMSLYKTEPNRYQGCWRSSGGLLPFAGSGRAFASLCRFSTINY